MRILRIFRTTMEEKDIKGDLASLQREVDGLLTSPYITRKFEEYNVCIYADDEALLKEDPSPTLAITTRSGKLINMIFGAIIFTAIDDEGETLGLTEEQIKFIKKELQEAVIHMHVKDKSVLADAFVIQDQDYV